MSVKSRTGRLVVLGAVLFTGMAFVAGCGGDSDSGSDDFVASANTICADYQAQSDAAEADFTAAMNSGDLEAAAVVFEDQADAMSTAIDEMEALEVPSDSQENVDQFIALSRDTADVTLEAADAIRNDDRQGLEAAVAEGDALDAESDALAEEIGLTDCLSSEDEA
ncbi:MAG: hypothetical protein QG596_1499 [Actinomycetota bacterium]|nr:hypothetical protein [Actinomycetota bacterium]